MFELFDAKLYAVDELKDLSLGSLIHCNTISRELRQSSSVPQQVRPLFVELSYRMPNLND